MLAPWIISHFPGHRVYVEAYGGGGSVLIRKPRSYSEVYNDLDGEIVNVFRMTRDHGEDLLNLLILTPFSREEFNLCKKETDDPLERARRTIAKSFMGFGSNSIHQSSGFRPNSNRSGSTPAHDWANYPGKLNQLIERLRAVIIENKDAVEVLQQHDSDETLHYVDPPYVPETRNPGKDYKFEMTTDDHERLAETLHQLIGPVVLSGYRCDLYDHLYSDWYRVEKNTFADGAKPRIECLWLSNNCSIKQQRLFA